MEEEIKEQPVEKKKTDEITVLITNWNYGMFLREAIDSVLNQTVLPMEIVIADDGSTDESDEIIREYIEKHPFLITVIKQPQRTGLINNLNSSASWVKTPWMCFLAADDKFDPTYIEKVLKVIKDPQYGERLALVYSDMMKFGNWSGLWEVINWDPAQLRQGNYINGHAVFKKKVWEEVGGYKDNGNFEDHQMWVDMLDLGKDYYGVRIPEALVFYRRHDFGHRTDKTDINQRQNRK